jgi:hypothetical protein
MIYDQEVRHTLRMRQQQLPLSSFSWGDVFFKSCRDDNIKRLDLTTYLSLRGSVAKRPYRFLDKRSYVRGDRTFDLRELAFEHVGLSRNYTAAKTKEKLQPALEELEAIGFLRPTPRTVRDTNVGRGERRVRLVHVPVPAIVAKPAAGPGGLVPELIARGVTAAAAREVVKTSPEERVRLQTERVDYLRATKPKKIADLAADLVAAIREDYAPPGVKPPTKTGGVRIRSGGVRRRRRGLVSRKPRRRSDSSGSNSRQPSKPGSRRKPWRTPPPTCGRAAPTPRRSCRGSWSTAFVRRTSGGSWTRPQRGEPGVPSGPSPGSIIRQRRVQEWTKPNPSPNRFDRPHRPA